MGYCEALQLWNDGALGRRESRRSGHRGLMMQKYDICLDRCDVGNTSPMYYNSMKKKLLGLTTYRSSFTAMPAQDALVEQRLEQLWWSLRGATMQPEHTRR